MIDVIRLKPVTAVPRRTGLTVDEAAALRMLLNETREYVDRRGTVHPAHQMSILHEDGLYRHIRFQKPGTSMWRFDLITWPGHLVITGDVQDFHFARLPDMFEFFRSPVGYINSSYWAEKLCGRHQRCQSYSPERLKRRVFEHFQDSRAWLPQPHRPLWRAICEQVLADDVICDEGLARHALNDFRFTLEDRLPDAPVEDFRPHRVSRYGSYRSRPADYEFADTWEWDLREYDYHFLLSLHAIVWGINQYDQAKTP